MKEKTRNQAMGKEKKRYWGFAFIISISVLFLFLLGIVYLPESMEFMIISFISIPLLSCVFTFYQWIYAYLTSKRLLQPEMLWQNNRLYHIAEITTATRTSSIMNAVFCICLLFALTSFVFGTLLLNDEPKIFMSSNQRLMGLLQISICIIFLTIYFSILSFQQIIDIKRQAKNIRILSYMGKNQAQIRSLLKTQIMIKLLLPTLMCLVLLIAAPFINLKLNMELSGTTSNLFMKTVGEFLVCFIILYFFYFQMVYRISNRYIKRLWTRDHIFGN